MTLIKIDKITKVYKVSDEVETQALEEVSFEIEQGELVAIMGPSGSGKSTLMNILGALDTPTSGEYWLDGKKVSDLEEDDLAEIRNKKIGFVFQAYNLLPRASALRNVMVPMMYGEVSKKKRADRAKELLETVGLGDRLNYKSNQLSGGQQQRVAIARALAMKPAIVLADEPTGNISGKHVEELMKVFLELNKKGHTIILITHDKDIARYARRKLVIRDGRLVANK